ncbi:MAG: MmgE/PrpD family protein [Candidatus Hodarchaeota archaeon]
MPTSAGMGKLKEKTTWIRDEIAHFCAKMTFDALPEETVQLTKVCLMDQICLMIASNGTYTEDYPDIVKFVREMGGKQESTIIGSGGKVPCLNATLVNTAIGVNEHFDAVHKSTILHVPASLLPGLLAVAENQKTNGKDLILAAVIGSEIMTRFGMSLRPRETYARGFHPTAVCAPLGCAVGAGKLLGLEEGELAEALSIASTQAAGSSVWGGPIHPATWSFQVGRAAESGVMAAMLAQIGFSGVDRIFEDERGFFYAYSQNPDPTKLTEGLGQRYDIRELSFKRFGVGIYIMTSIEALLQILHEHEISAENIEEITVKLPTVVVPLVGFPAYPENRACTHLNTRYILAATAYMGSDMIYNMELFGPKRRKDPRVIELFKRIDLVGDPELDKLFPEKKPCILGIKTKDGEQFSQRNDGPFKGDPENPLSEGDVETKFNKITVPILGPQKASQIISMIKQLDVLDDISQLVDLLVV